MHIAISPPLGYLTIPLRCVTLPPATHVNCYIIGHDDALIVDPGSAFPAEQERLSELLYQLRGTGSTFSAIILTHHHRDHSAGVEVLAERFDLPIGAHEATFARLPHLLCDASTRRIQLKEGHRLVVDHSRELQVLHTPGHALGHCCLLEQRTRVLVAGDMVSGLGSILIDPSEGEMVTYIDSLSRLRAFNPAWVLPGHGPPMPDGATVFERLIERRQWRKSLVWNATRQGERAVSTFEATRYAYPELKEMLTRSPFALIAAYRSTRSHLIQLERTGEACRVGSDGWRAVEQ